jgi:Domain of unknown function (DUF4348)
MQLKKNSFTQERFSKVLNFGKVVATLSVLFVILSLSTSCKKNAKAKEMIITPEQAQALPADFIDFYKKFHSDSLFQVAHIQFPLEGYPSQVDEKTIAEGTFRWTADTWRMHRMEAFTDSVFTRKFESPLPEMVMETIKQRNSPFAMYRRFYKRGTDWTLIYYSDMNAMKEGESSEATEAADPSDLSPKKELEK